MKGGYYAFFIQKTKNLPFGISKNEPQTDDEEDIHKYRLHSLLTQIRNMALRKFFEMPESFQELQSKEDWIHDSMIVFIDLMNNYNPERGLFDHYIRFMMPRRLTSIQRSLFRKNPPVEEELRKIIQELKWKNGKTPTPAEVSELTGRSESDVAKLIEAGFGERVVTGQENRNYKRQDIENTISTETLYIKKETMLILWKCIDSLDSIAKLIFIRHEINGLSFKILFEEFDMNKLLNAPSLATFKRRYENIFNKVKACVKKNYATQAAR